MWHSCPLPRCVCALPPAPTNSLAIHGRTIIVTLISYLFFFFLLPSRRANALFCCVKLCVRDAPLGNNVAKCTLVHNYIHTGAIISYSGEISISILGQKLHSIYLFQVLIILECVVGRSFFSCWGILCYFQWLWLVRSKALGFVVLLIFTVQWKERQFLPLSHLLCIPFIIFI